MPVIWLAYLGVLFFQPALDTSSVESDWAVAVGLIVLFLPLYVASHREVGDRHPLAVIVAMAALGAVGSLVNGGAIVFVVYAAAAAGHLEPTGRAVRVIAALVGVVAVMTILSPAPYPWRFVAFAPALIFTMVIGIANIFDAERERAERRLRRADEEIERLATLAERERIARDLHDLLGHTLSIIVVKSEVAARLAEREPARARDEMREVERIGREALSEVRAAVAGYRARGLRGELDGAQRALSAAGVEATVEAELPALPIAYESALGLALRESVTNVVRHADAKHATIRIAVEEADVVLEVADDGRGGAAPEGAGLTGMRERISALGGSVQQDGGPGMRVRVTLPIEATTVPRERLSESAGQP
jgi:two-component system, NarL family, sensor histidine kinase DesK